MLLTVTFYVLPILVAIMALATYSKSDEVTDESSGTGDDAKKTTKDPIQIIEVWIFICLGVIVLFGWSKLTTLMIELYEQAKNPDQVKLKVKAVGGYSEEDPLRQLQLRESIYALAFATNLSYERLEMLGVPEACRPKAQMRAEINLTALFCAFC